MRMRMMRMRKSDSHNDDNDDDDDNNKNNKMGTKRTCDEETTINGRTRKMRGDNDEG